MNDLLDITLALHHKPFGATREKQPEDGLDDIKTTQFSKTLFIKAVPAFVTSLGDGNKINIRCCPLKVLQGHNVFGTNKLNKLCNHIIFEVLNCLNITASDQQLQDWELGEYDIDEIHLTHRFPVEHPRLIKRVIFHLHRYTSMEMAPSVISTGVGVTLLAPHRLAKWIFYDKGKEFNDKRKNEHKYLEAHTENNADADKASDLLRRTASESVRAELKLSKAYLKKHNLNRGKYWTHGKVKEVYLHELSLLCLGTLPSLPELPEMYKLIDDAKLRSVVILWANGEDLSDHFKPTTFGKYRREIRDKLGIDIQKDHPLLKPAHIKLADIFDPTNMLAGFPKWARKYPALAFR